jgi:hypothetical protein
VSRPRVAQAGGAVVGPAGPSSRMDGVKVDNSAALVLGDLGVGEPGLCGERLAGEPGLAGEGPAEGDREAAPQFGGAGVEQHRACVVVAAGAQWLAELVTVAGVLLGAGRAVAVWAGLGVPSRVAGLCLAVEFAVGVDGAE